MMRGSELKKASRREPSVWMRSLISEKRGNDVGRGRGEGIKKGQASSSPLPNPSVFSCCVPDVHVGCFCLFSLVEISKEKTEQKWAQGAGMQKTHLKKSSTGSLKRNKDMIFSEEKLRDSF